MMHHAVIMADETIPAPVLWTPRLILRPYEASDIDAMAAMFGDPDVTAFTLLGQRDRTQTEGVLAGYRAYLGERGYGMYAILDRETGDYLGEVGLFDPPAAAKPNGRLALRYALAKSGWGRGYAPEASAAIIDDAFDRLGVSAMLAGVMGVNKPSIRVMEKLGFVEEGEATTHGKTFTVFGLTREVWRRRGGWTGSSR
jgi:RimJ/RimL family protein N-acetyltransferase